MGPSPPLSAAPDSRGRALKLSIGVGLAALGFAAAAALNSWPSSRVSLVLAAAIGAMTAGAWVALAQSARESAAELPSQQFDPRRFLDESAEAAFIASLDGVIRSGNAHFAALAAIDPNRAAGSTITDALPGPIVDAITLALEHGLDSTGSVECENRAGEWLIVEIALQRCELDGVTAFAFTMRDLTEARRREIELATLAFQDPLTHLANRAAVQRRLERLKDDLAEGPEASFAIMALDLDRFKQINDQLGHAAGDRLLVEIAARIVSALPRNAFVGRYGGDEFVIVVGPRVGHATARQFAQRLIDAAARPIALPSGLVNVGLSIGVAIAPIDGGDAMALLEGADAAMYRAKRAGCGVAFMKDEDELLKSVA